MGSLFSNPVSKDTNLTQTYILYVRTSIVLSALNGSLTSNQKIPMYSDDIKFCKGLQDKFLNPERLSGGQKKRS